MTLFRTKIFLIQCVPGAWVNDCFTAEINDQKRSVARKLKDRNLTSNQQLKVMYTPE